MSRRIKGRALSLEIDGVEYMADVTNVVLENEEAEDDVTTFADAATGGAVDWFFTVELVQSLEGTSFWRYIWENSGSNEIAYTFAPEGNAVASEDAPHFTGTLTMK